MQINFSGASASSIVKTSEELGKLQKESGNEYLFLNRGVNAVCPIDLDQIIPKINFNSKEIQHYPNSKGKIGLREAINDEYFNKRSGIDNIIITPGGISGLDVCFQNINVDKIILPAFFWGTYTKILTIRNIKYGFYEGIYYLEKHINDLKNSAVIICDPGNPLGIKNKDQDLISVIKKLNDNGVIVLIDSPYRRIFFDKADSFYQNIGLLDNIIIIESFSKSIGLSGLRTGFIHSVNTDFISEFYKRNLYATNGVNSFSQTLIEKLITTPEGIVAVSDFKKKTSKDISLNIEFLNENNFLPKEIYKGEKLYGIFAAINKSEKELMEKRIGSVPLAYFTEIHKNSVNNYSRICVSIPHEKFIRFFSQFIF